MNYRDKNYIFLDAETDGLYGAFLTVALVVTDGQGNEIERGYYGIRKDRMQVSDPWVRENVLPILGEYEPCEDEDDLLEKVWTMWRKYADSAYAVADVAFPVECRLFQKCVMRSPKERTFQAPFPLLDLGSILFAKGIDPLSDRVKLSKLESSARLHNALYDAEAAAKIFRDAMTKSDRSEAADS